MMAFLKSRGVEKGFDAGTGYSYLSKALMTMWAEERGSGMKPYQEAAIKYAKDNHVYSSDLFEANNAANRSLGFYWDKATQIGASSVESVTRQMAFLSYVELLHENGFKAKDGLYEAAKKLTDIQMNNYSHTEAPRAYMAAGGPGKVAYNLMSFKHNELSRLAMLSREIAKNGNASPLLTHIMASVAFSGIMGTILYSEADWLVKEISTSMGNPTSLTKILLDNQSISEFFKYGIGSTAGVDLTSRLGVGPLVPGQGKAADVLMPGAGKLVNIASTGKDLVVNRTEYDLKNFIRELLPNSVSGIIDRTWFSPKVGEKELAINRSKVLASATRNDADKLWKTLGMTGIHEARQKALNYENQRIDKAFSDKRKKIIEKASKVFFTSGKIPEDFAKDYITAQGNPDSIAREITQIAIEQQIPQQQLLLIQNAMSKSLTSMHRVMRATGKE